MEVHYDSRSKIWSSPKSPLLYSEEASVGRIMYNTMKNWPKNVCQISDSEGITVTNGEAITWAIRIAQHLKKRGLDHNDVIGIFAKLTTYLMPVAVGCLLNATPFHAVNPILDEESVKKIYGMTKPKLILCDGREYQKVLAATSEWQPEIISITDHTDNATNIKQLLEPTTTEHFYQPVPLRSSDQTVVIICSSGTSGVPKAVCISNNAFIPDAFMSTSEIVFFLTSGLDWISGLFGLIGSTIYGCTRIITDKPFTIEYFVELVQKYKINFTTLAPVQLTALVGCKTATPEALSSLRIVNYGGAIVSESTLHRVQELCKQASVSNLYGMTEAGAIAMNIGLKNLTTVGRIVPGIRLQIIDEDGKNLGHNEVGEILVHTGKPWNGYYGNPVETRKIQDYQGWIHTGDLGYVDSDNYVYIVDRKKETLKYMGMQYGPSEIESVVHELAGIMQVCVVGVPDEKVGDMPSALVVKAPGSTISAKEIIDYVAKRLPVVMKQLHGGVKFTDTIPTNANGKFLRKAAIQMFQALN